MVPRGLEPRTLWLLAISSNQLSYETSDEIHLPFALSPSAAAEFHVANKAIDHCERGAAKLCDKRAQCFGDEDSACEESPM